MGDLSYQQQSPFLLDPPYFPDTPIEMPFLTQHVGLDMSTASPCFPYYFSSAEASTTDTRTYESSGSLDSGVKPGGRESQMDNTSVVVEPIKSLINPTMKRGKSYSSLNQSKGTKGNKGRKQLKKPSGGLKGREEKKSRDDEKKETKACEETPTGYIHVRARRGQATDSHSLAERVRREKISLRMKVLQGLVPGCEKVVGKALMLDEIINYVQSLQNQVEFLSMNLASSNPMLYDFGVDLDGCMNPEKLGNIVQSMPSLQQSNEIPPLAREEATSSYQLVNTSARHLLHGQGPTAYSQDNTSYLMQVDGHNQVGLSTMFPFP